MLCGPVQKFLTFENLRGCAKQNLEASKQQFRRVRSTSDSFKLVFGFGICNAMYAIVMQCY